MNFIFRQTQLYKFLKYCSENNLEKVVLDCGAGGKYPPLALFLEYGYKTLGIEISDSQIEKAKAFADEFNINLNINKGDIKQLPFDDESISYIYSYNTIFHMKKSDMTKGINEIKRVLKTGGICFINFLSVNDSDFGKGEKIGKNEFLQDEWNDKVIHTFYETDEAEAHFEDMKILFKENRILERYYHGRKIREGFIDYIVEKI